MRGATSDRSASSGNRRIEAMAVRLLIASISVDSSSHITPVYLLYDKQRC